MKIIKPRYDYLLLLYLPIVVAGAALAFFFTLALITIFAISGVIFLVTALIIALSPLGKQTMPGTKLTTPQWLGRLWALQLGSGFVYWVFQAATPQGTFTPLSFNSGLYPWPLYLLFAIALTYFNGSLTASLRPSLGKISEGIVGVGADLFLKQNLFFITAFTLAILILQICPISIGLHFQTLLLGSLLSMLITSPFWRRYMHYLWHERYTAKTFLFTTVLLIITAILIFNTIVALLAPYLPILKPPSFQFTSNPLYWPLLKFIWWLAWTPLIVQLLRSIMQGRQVREIIMMGLILPILLGLPLPSLILYPFIKLLLVILTMGLIIFSFHDQAIAQLLFAARAGNVAQLRLSLSTLRNLLFLIVATLIVYALLELTLITPFVFGLAAPCFFAICAACSSYIFSSQKSK